MQKVRAKREAEGSNADRTLVELKGKCFNVTLAVTKHLLRCPWCPDPNVQIVVGGQSGQSSMPEDSLSLFSTSQPLFIYNCIILALSGGIVIAFASLACTLFVHYRYRRRKTGGGGGATGRDKKKKNFVVGVNGESGYGNHYSSNGAKRLLKYAPLPSDRLPPEQQLRPPCPRTVPSGLGMPSTPNKQCFRRQPPPFSPPTVSRMSNIHRGDLILALEGDSRVVDTGPLTSDREQR